MLWKCRADLTILSAFQMTSCKCVWLPTRFMLPAWPELWNGSIQEECERRCEIAIGLIGFLESAMAFLSSSPILDPSKERLT